MQKLNFIPSDLKAFSSYSEFEKFCKSLFSLKSIEYKKLYKVLIKLESIGEDPKENLKHWKNKFSREECIEFIRFLILVDSTDLAFSQ
ncbi:hypothetical protein QUF70_04305 [Desulfobacterales bacterium HSG17]|nr:hypothetical protein [Desulfobacterales bacterium HSG17]